MTPPETQPSSPEESPRESRLRVFLRWSFLAILPIVLGLYGYYRPVLRGEPVADLHADGAFYQYQLRHSYELGGRWWRLVEDENIGAPYQSELGKHPGLFEGVDVILTSALFGRFLNPQWFYHFGVLTILAFNGWVAGWLTRRLTKSTFWAAVAIMLITLNYPTQGRVMAHLHLFKYGWVLLAVVAFKDYLHRPGLFRGSVFGLAVALMLQSSYYYGYLLMLGLGVWWLGCLAAGRLGRRHVAATLAAGLALGVAGAALTFPVWTVAKRAIFSDGYFQRQWSDIGIYGAELWQYFAPITSAQAQEYIKQIGSKPPQCFGEATNFPGYTVLLGLAVYVVARLRGWKVNTTDPRLLDLMMGLIGTFVILSLAGGPAYFLFPLVSSFRCYGRAGLLAVALACVAGPVALHALTRSVRSRALRASLVGGLLALACFDSYESVRYFGWWPSDETKPTWVDWLAAQPMDVRLAALRMPASPFPFNWWGMAALHYEGIHGHATLNGADFQLLQGDLALVGATYERMNPAGLRLMTSLGYDHLALHNTYLDANPWIKSLPWLDRVQDLGDWAIYRTNDRTPRWPSRSLDSILAAQPKHSEPERIPARAWITGQLAIDREVVVPERPHVRMAWADASGRLLAKPIPALYQHLFGPGLPAFVAASPKNPGDYQLLFLDKAGRKLASRPYRVVADLMTTARAFPDKLPDIAARPSKVETAAGRSASEMRVVLENRSPYYIQANAARLALAPSAQVQPGLLAPWGLIQGSLSLMMHVEGGGMPRDVVVLLPRDLPPGGKVELALPADRIAGAGESIDVAVSPVFAYLGQKAESSAGSELALSVTAEPTAQATRGEQGEARRR